MFSTPPHTPNPLVTDIENLACSCFCKTATLFAKFEHFVRSRAEGDEIALRNMA